MALSPMMKQYNEIKEQYKDCLLMFRLGDFYELFFDDAYTASRELELTLTGRNCGLEERAPMCGVPFHAADSYIAKLAEKGYKVAICEQMEDPATAKGIVKRDVIRIVTPGTLDIGETLAASDNTFIMSVCLEADGASIAYADYTTGEFYAFEVTGDRDHFKTVNEISRIAPREIIVPDEKLQEMTELAENEQITAYINSVDRSYYRRRNCEKALLEHFEVSSVISLGIDNESGLADAAGSLIMYLSDTQRQDPAQIKHIVIRHPEDHMTLDRSTMRNLELLETLYDKRLKGSLLGVLDKTKTAMGGRLLKRFIKEPLIDPDKINYRQSGVEVLSYDRGLRRDISRSLNEIYDFERLTARVASLRANGKDLIALKNTLSALPYLKDLLSSIESEITGDIAASIDDFSDLYKLIDDAIVEDPPFTLTEGGLIKTGYSAELDELKDSIADAKKWITGLEAREKERTDIKTLKVGFNKVFGYYIDVSKSQIDKVPEEYIRKQTLVNNERYITPELKEKETLVLSAEAKINSVEYEIFRSVRSAVEPFIEQLQKASAAVALLDVLNSFAEVASANGYVRPVIDDSDVIDIRKGRHPSVEQMIGEGMFVPNDVLIDNSGKSMLVITGPNMAGKSTYMRQTAIIVLMAQIGSFVPCESARIGVCDRIFTRIGASDNLAYGQSTFFIEMSELANILRNSTHKSLVILDEIGRGTSTFDGLAIAWATIEYLCKDENRVRTMFATHYHELTILEENLKPVRNLSVAVSESGNNIVFLHTIIEGPASKSYGIHVAKIAGVPKEVRKKAQVKLQELEERAAKAAPAGEQLSFFDSFARTENDNDNNAYPEDYADIKTLLERISDIDLNNLTPLKALSALQDIQDEIQEITEDQ